LADSPVLTTWQRSLQMPTVRQVFAKGVMWPVWCRVRGRHFPAYSSINCYIKKPFSQIRGGKPSSALLPCKSLPTSYLRAVRSEYPAYIVRSAWTMSPVHPPVKCFFWDCSTCGRIFEGDFALKSRGFGGFGRSSGQDESVKSVERITYEA
jgi:hypothetical protein